MRSLLLRTKPSAAADMPVYALSMAMTVGMSAPPIPITSRNPKRSAKAAIIGRAKVCEGSATRNTPDRGGDQEYRDADEVLPGVDERPSRDELLELRERDAAAREGQEAEYHLRREDG